MTKHQESMLNDPYILVRNPEGRFIFLNRYYRLLGAGTDDLSYRECLEHPGIPGDQETVRACAINFADDTEHAGDDTEHAGYVRYWIHDDSTSPRQGGKFRDDYEAKVRSILTMSEDQAKETLAILGGIEPLMEVWIKICLKPSKTPDPIGNSDCYKRLFAQTMERALPISATYFYVTHDQFKAAMKRAEYAVAEYDGLNTVYRCRLNKSGIQSIGGHSDAVRS